MPSYYRCNRCRVKSRDRANLTCSRCKTAGGDNPFCVEMPDIPGAYNSFVDRDDSPAPAHDYGSHHHGGYGGGGGGSGGYDSGGSSGGGDSGGGGGGGGSD